MIRKDVSTTLLIAVILGAVNAVLNPAKLAELRLQPREELLRSEACSANVMKA
jgi:hypothetical protein